MVDKLHNMIFIDICFCAHTHGSHNSICNFIGDLIVMSTDLVITMEILLKRVCVRSPNI